MHMISYLIMNYALIFFRKMLFSNRQYRTYLDELLFWMT